MMQNTRSIIV